LLLEEPITIILLIYLFSCNRKEYYGDYLALRKKKATADGINWDELASCKNRSIRLKKEVKSSSFPVNFFKETKG